MPLSPLRIAQENALSTGQDGVSPLGGAAPRPRSKARFTGRSFA